MRLDATTPELVKLLGRYGYAVHHPVECEISDQLPASPCPAAGMSS